MEKINYTLTLEDCNNYARSQSKIPRLKKYLKKTTLEFFIRYIIFMIILYFIFFSISIHDICLHNHLTLSSILTNKYFPHFLSSQIKYFSIQAVILILFFIIFVKFIRHFFGGKTIYKMLSGIDLNYELTASEENLTRTNKNGTQIINWATIIDIYDTKYNYLIFISDLQAIIIPKRCFENEEQGKQFYSQIESYYNKAKQNNQ